MPAPTYFDSASTPADGAAATGVEPATAVITPPGSMLAGDLVIMLGAHRSNIDTMTVSETGNQTWKNLGVIDGTSAGFRVFWCEFNGAWPANPSIAFAAETGTIPCSAIMHVFRPAVKSKWVYDIPIAGGVEASASPTVITGITPGHPANVTLAAWMIPNISTWGTLAGAGWAVTGTAQYRNSTGSDISAAFAHQLQNVPAATGDVSLIPSVAAAGVSFIVSWYALPIGQDYQLGINHRR